MSNDVIFRVTCPLGNKVDLWEKTWLGHITIRHDDQDISSKIDNVRDTVRDPDYARRSRHKTLGATTCIYQKVIGETNEILLVPVLFDSPTYESGGLLGHVMTAYISEPGMMSFNVGEIFWTADRLKEKP
ncbi:MAG: hypothetical protein ABSD63_05460 [Candidatus Korobacteraceae bacterium]|jgi:hypothetical protein